MAVTPGNRYAIALANRSGARVLTVLSVDGVSAVSGELAGWDQAGHVLDRDQRTQMRSQGRRSGSPPLGRADRTLGGASARVGGRLQ